MIETSDIDPALKQEIALLAGEALGLKIKVMCAVKTAYASPADRGVPLGSVLVLFLLRMRHLPVWWWRKKQVYRVVRAAVPMDRMVFVYPISQGHFSSGSTSS